MITILKNERLREITRLANQRGVVSVNDISKHLKVSSMTIRRDLDELATDNKIIRVHGGAQSVNFQVGSKELSHTQKRALNKPEKAQIAKIVSSMINDGETIFLGTGTTNELVAQYLKVKNVRIITNSLPVFEGFRRTHPEIDIALVGGKLREYSGAFIGSLANSLIEQLHFQKSFISVNGVNNNKVTSSNPDEGQMQKLALDRSDQKYIVADHTKFDQEDFYTFYALDNVDGLITDASVPNEFVKKYEGYTRIIK